jgi:hypothetical protein
MSSLCQKRLDKVPMVPCGCGCGGRVLIANLFAFRSPHPRDLKNEDRNPGGDPVGPFNDGYLRKVLAADPSPGPRQVVGPQRCRTAAVAATKERTWSTRASSTR